MFRFRLFLSVAVLVLASNVNALGKVMEIKWSELPALPPPPGQTRQAGLAGPFAGTHGDVLLVGGGANFPEKLPWEGGAKAWWDDLFVLERTADGAVRWLTEKHFKLPRALAYGASFSTSQGVICAGGCDAARCYADVFLLSWDSGAREIVKTDLPPMPEPLAFMASALIGETLYVAGGQHGMSADAAPSKAFWSLDLSQRKNAATFKWSMLPSWPGPARIVPVAAAQGGRFFLFSGRAPRPGTSALIMSDAFAFDPLKRAWTTLAPIGTGGGGVPLSVMAGTAATVGDEILLFSGDDGGLFLTLESLDLEIAALRRKLGQVAVGEKPAVEAEIDVKLQAKKQIYGTHPGFNRQVLAYAPNQNRWRLVTQSPVPGQVTTVAVRWGDGIVIPNGEIRPGIRTPNVTLLTPISK